MTNGWVVLAAPKRVSDFLGLEVTNAMAIAATSLNIAIQRATDKADKLFAPTTPKGW